MKAEVPSVAMGDIASVESLGLLIAMERTKERETANLKKGLALVATTVVAQQAPVDASARARVTESVTVTSNAARAVAIAASGPQFPCIVRALRP